MLGPEDSQRVGYHRRRSSLEVGTLPTTSSAQHHRKQPSAYFHKETEEVSSHNFFYAEEGFWEIISL